MSDEACCAKPIIVSSEKPLGFVPLMDNGNVVMSRSSRCLACGRQFQPTLVTRRPADIQRPPCGFVNLTCS